MYVIIVYDVGVNRVNKVCQFLRQYLNWVQNSVFEGELTESELAEIESRLKKLMDLDVDSLIVYTFWSNRLFKKRQMGVKKTDLTPVI